MSPPTRRRGPGSPLRTESSRNDLDHLSVPLGSTGGAATARVASWLRRVDPDLERERQRQAELRVRAYLLDLPTHQVRTRRRAA